MMSRYYKSHKENKKYDEEQIYNDENITSRGRYLNKWFNRKERFLYNRYLEDRDEAGLISLEKCRWKGYCPICQIKSLEEKIGTAKHSHYIDSVTYKKQDQITMTIKDRNNKEFHLELSLDGYKMMKLLELNYKR